MRTITISHPDLEGGSKIYETTGRICAKCSARVYKSDNPEYAYQCFECDEDLYRFETYPEDELKPEVEGTKEDPGFVNLERVD